MKTLYKNIAVLLIILSLGILFHKNYVKEFPKNIHAWAQSDRYALALGFTNNNLDFFKPETFVLNHQFPDDWKVPSNESITAVDFPIHDYIPAIAMKLTGEKSPFLFRIYILLYSFLGLFFLYRLSMLICDDFFKSIFVVLFAATSPVFVYYQGGFLPTIPSLSNAIIGLFFYVLFVQRKKNQNFTLSIVFLTLATLSRTTFAIPLLAVFGVELIRIFRRQSKLKSKILAVSISVVVILAFYFFNGVLRDQYGSIFLNHLLPARSFQEMSEILVQVKNNWLFQYFSKIHYAIFALLAMGTLVMLLRKKEKEEKEKSTFIFLTGVVFLGCILFALLMLRQFPAHDYYFLDTFFLPVLLVIIFLLSRMPQSSKLNLKIIYAVGVVLLAIPVTLNAYSSQKGRYVEKPWDRTTATINNFTNSNVFLDSLGVPKESKILVIDAYAPNIPFILMDRKGYAVMSTKKENIKSSLAWEYDYIAMQNEFFISDIYTFYPEIISRVEKVADNGKLIICKRSNKAQYASLDQFLKKPNSTPKFEASVSFDTVDNSLWQNIVPTSENFWSGETAGLLSSDMEYGITYKTKDLPCIRKSTSTLYFSSYFMQKTVGDCEIVLSINEDGQNTFYKSFNLKDILRSKDTWEKVDLVFQLPQIKSQNYEFALYLWNTGQIDLFADDFSLKIY